MESLDPRVRRLSMLNDPDQEYQTDPAGQENTYEVFVQTTPQKPYENVGTVHGSFLEAAFLYAKEQYSRRGGTCNGIAVVREADVHASPYAKTGETGWQADAFAHALAAQNVHPQSNGNMEREKNYHIFAIAKRGKYARQLGTVKANGLAAAAQAACSTYTSIACVAFWIIEEDKMLFSNPEQKQIWNMLPEKKYRDAQAYKTGENIDKIKNR